MSVKTAHLNLEDRALDGWIALHHLLWRFDLAPQYYETSLALRMLSKLENNLCMS